MDEERLTYNEMLKAAEQTARSARGSCSAQKRRSRRLGRRKSGQRNGKERRRNSGRSCCKAKDEALMIVKEAREEMEALIKEARKLPGKSKPDRDRAAAEIRGKIEKRKKKLDPVKKARPKKQVTAAELAAGDDVYICSMGVEATVLEKPDTKGNAYVQAGIMKLYVNVNDLEKRGDAGGHRWWTQAGFVSRREACPCPSTFTGIRWTRPFWTWTNIWMMLPLQGLHEVMIVHGKGTGALRSGVQRFCGTTRMWRAFGSANTARVKRV